VSPLALHLLRRGLALATTGPSIGGASTGMTAEQIEYAKMMGKDPGAAKSSGGFPTTH
jgi:nitrate/nitrite transport system permease protein